MTVVRLRPFAGVSGLAEAETTSSEKSVAASASASSGLGVRHDHPCLDTAEFGHTFGQQLAVANPHEPRAPPDADQFFRHTALDRPGPEFVFPVSGEGKRRTQSQMVHQRGGWFDIVLNNQ